MELLSSLKTKVELATAGDYQRRVLLALTNDNTPTQNAQLVQLALSTYQWSNYQEIVDLLLPLLRPPSSSSSSPSFHWRQTYKALLLLQALLRHGNDEIVHDLRRTSMEDLARLEHVSVVEDGREKGGGIREAAARIRGLVMDVEAFKIMREEARQQRESYHGAHPSDDHPLPRRSSHNDEAAIDAAAATGGAPYRRSSAWMYEQQHPQQPQPQARPEQLAQRRNSATASTLPPSPQPPPGRSPSHPLAHHPSTPSSHVPLHIPHSPALPPAHPTAPASTFSATPVRPPSQASSTASPASTPPPIPPHLAQLALSNPKLAAAIVSSGFRPRASSLHNLGVTPASPSSYHTPQLNEAKSKEDLSWMLEDGSKGRVPVLSPPGKRNGAGTSAFAFMAEGREATAQQQQPQRAAPEPFVPDYLKEPPNREASSVFVPHYMR